MPTASQTTQKKSAKAQKVGRQKQPTQSKVVARNEENKHSEWISVQPTFCIMTIFLQKRICRLRFSPSYLLAGTIVLLVMSASVEANAPDDMSYPVPMAQQEHSEDEPYQYVDPYLRKAQEDFSQMIEADKASSFDTDEADPSDFDFQVDSDESYMEDHTDTGRRWTSIDILISIFFLIAAGWLLLAIFYSLLILFLMRLQARGELDVYDEDFGTFYICGGRVALHLGCILRRYAIQLEQEQQLRQRHATMDGDRPASDEEEPRPIRIMTRSERRCAIERLLANSRASEKTPIAEALSTSPDEDLASEEEPICTICLAELDCDKPIFTSSVCVHRFHKMCIMAWLERKQNTECPCCRENMVSDDDIWKIVKATRKEDSKFSSKVKSPSRRVFVQNLSITRRREESSGNETSPSAIYTMGLMNTVTYVPGISQRSDSLDIEQGNTGESTERTSSFENSNDGEASGSSDQQR